VCLADTGNVVVVEQAKSALLHTMVNLVKEPKNVVALVLVQDLQKKRKGVDQDLAPVRVLALRSTKKKRRADEDD